MDGPFILTACSESIFTEGNLNKPEQIDFQYQQEKPWKTMCKKISINPSDDGI